MKSLQFILLIALLLCFTGCLWQKGGIIPEMQNDSKSAVNHNLSINLQFDTLGKISKKAPADCTSIEVEIVEDKILEKFDAESGGAVIFNVSPGSRTIRVSAYNSQNELAYFGQFTAQVAASRVTAVNVILNGTGTIFINNNAYFTMTLGVDLNITSLDMTMMRISNDADLSTAVWENVSTTKSWNLSAGPDGDRYVYIQFKNSRGQLSKVFSDTIVFDTVPSPGTVVINSGDLYTNILAVNLTISAVDITDMILSNSTDFSSSTWEPFNASKAWSLDAGADGTRDVFIKFRNAIGNESAPASDSIILDTAPPAGGTIVINSGDADTNVLNVTLSLSASGATEMMVSNASDFLGASWQAYSTSLAWSLAPGSAGSRDVYVKYRDDADNQTSSFMDGINYAPLPSNVIAVKSSATGTNDGSSWLDAFSSLKDAITEANTNGAIDEIWVAAGTYKPGTLNTDRFQLYNNVAIYGGFSGTETSRNQRNWSSNVTLLSGDLGSGVFALHVLYANSVSSSALIDGFTISNGLANVGTGNDRNGAGLIMLWASPTVTNCVFSNNTANGWGGAVYGQDSSPIIKNCLFTNNTANIYGTIHFFNPTTGVIENCTMIGNSASASSGGIYYQNSTGGTVINSVIWGNSPASQIFNNNSTFTVAYSCIQGGHAGTGNTSLNPTFTAGPFGSFYLSNTASGQGSTSPCVDSGSDTAVARNMDLFTTRTDNVLDTGTVDMGFHYQD